MKTLKTVLKFWQEIVFVIPLGILLIEMSTKYFVVFRQTIDIACFCFFSILLICLVGQFFWKNKILAVILSVVLGLSSFVLILISLYALTTSLQVVQAVAMLFLGLFLSFTAIKMFMKFFQKNIPTALAE